LTNGNGPFTISWSNGSLNTNQIQQLPAGNYSVMVTDSSNCTSFQSFTITEPNPLSAGLTPTQVNCSGAENGSIDLTVYGGTFPFTYQWSSSSGPFAQHEDITGLIPGTYTVLVTDSKNCQTTASIGITQPAALSATFTYQDNPCFHDELGSINLTVTGGKTPYQYLWTGPGNFQSNSEDPQNLFSGLYTGTITDLNGCTYGPVEVYINEPDSMSLTANMTNAVTCLGFANGQAQAVATGGNFPYTFAWSGQNGYVFNGPNPTNLSQGSYQVIATDAKNCQASDSIFITTILDTTSPVITCIPNQTIATTGNGCSYIKTGNSWNASATDNCKVSQLFYTLSGATSGTGTSLNGVAFSLGITHVTWTAIDSLGNEDTCTFNVTVEDYIPPTIVNCSALVNQLVNMDFGNCSYLHQGNGWNAQSTDNCSTATLSYVLSGATTGSGTNLNNVLFQPGSTLVTWTASDGSENQTSCSFTVQVNDEEDPVLANCPSNILVGTAPGTCQATVSWLPPAVSDNCSASVTSSHTSGSIFSVGTTTVTYTATDASSNSSSCSFTITVVDNQLPQIMIPSSIQSCNQLVTFATPTATDNCGIQSLSQTAGLPSGSQFPVGTTTNTFTATDIHGNVNSVSFTVTIYPTPVVTLEPTNVSCFGYGDGVIFASVTNGNAPYVFDWSNGSANDTVLNLVPGVYDVEVTDIHGCQANAETEITQPTPISVNAIQSNVSCFAGSNGSIDLTTSGGSAPYFYAWNTGQNTEDIEGIGAGAYQSEISDINGCIVLFSTMISEPEPLAIQATSNEAICTASNGNIRVLITGGTTPYEYDWSNGATTMNLTNVPAGTYTLIVEDSNGCNISYTGTIDSYSDLSAELQVKDAVCNGQSSGEIHAEILSGTGPFTYEWSNGASLPDIENLHDGVYLVTITDVNGCTLVLQDTVDQPAPIVLTLETSVYAAGTAISTFGNDDGSISVSIIGGLEPYSYEWSNGASTATIQGLTEGTYTVTVIDQTGCSASASIKLTQPVQLEIPSGFSPNGDSRNDWFVVRGIEAYPDNELTIYNRWGNIVFQKDNYSNEWDGSNNSGEALPDGTYFVLLKAVAEETTTLKGFVDLRR
jgi:gliding motility-associated-like protein